MFRATCRLKEVRYVERGELPADVRDALMRVAEPIKYPTTEEAAAERKRWHELIRGHEYSAKHGGYRMEIACPFGETTDRATFEQHMAEAHGRKVNSYVANCSLEGSNASLIRTARSKFRGPKAPPEQAPFKASAKEIAKWVRECPSCGLLAQVDGPCVPGSALTDFEAHVAECSAEAMAS